MTRARPALCALLAACAAGPRRPGPVAPRGLPLTRAERSGYTETSRYADVIAFLDSLHALGAPAWMDIGRTTEGRAIPLVALSRPVVRTPAEARRLGRPIVYVQANIHAGEVEGKEALQALMRDLWRAPSPGVLDSIVLLANPIYNADGNERFASETVNRREQNGPGLVGTRANAAGLDLNRDYVKAEAPETRASLAAITAWDPDVFVDLHTTDGSFHGYALTYAPSLAPAAVFTGPYTRDSLLPELRRRMRARHGLETFEYGNFDRELFAGAPADSAPSEWSTYDPRPRFGTNLVGVRGRIAILSEAFSHDPFAARVHATYAFVREILSLVAERATRIRALSAAADSTTIRWGGNPTAAPMLPLRSVLTRRPRVAPVLVEELARTGDTTATTEPGVPPGVRRTGRIVAMSMLVRDRFDATLERRLPAAYALPAPDTGVVNVLRAHGVRVDRLEADWTTRVERFVVDGVLRAARPFQGHHEVRLAGRWQAAPATIPAGSWVVRTAQPLGIVAFTFLEPESDDGLATWNAFDAELRVGDAFPVVRIPGPSPSP